MKRTQTMFGIVGRWPGGKEYLYSGIAYQRQDAVRQHCRDIGASWAELKKRGHRAVKVTVTWEDRD
jgi:hypothetical protein